VKPQETFLGTRLQDRAASLRRQWVVPSRSLSSGLPGRRQILAASLRTAVGAIAAAATARAASPEFHFDELRRIPAEEAHQAVAADKEFVYAIGNHVIGKYEKQSGKRVAVWQCENGKPLIHLDSGVVRNGTLYCAHSNYPGVPMVSSVERWNAETLTHEGTWSFGILAGSATWLDFRNGDAYVTFAHYAGNGGELNHDPRWTTLIQFDSEWRRRQAWVYPQAVVSRLGQMSVSGGTFTSGGRLICTGHDNPELYVLRFPSGGSVLELEAIVPSTIPGQGIAIDPGDRSILYGIDRRKREIVVGRLRGLPGDR
jgi:hypothetical protein